MGGGASLSHVPQEILYETAEWQSSCGIDTCRNQLILSRKVLSNMYSRTDNVATSAGVGGGEKQFTYEMPVNVIALLESIGIYGVEACDAHHPHDAGAHSGNARKLVSHIFECLGALHHLVRASQNHQQQQYKDNETSGGGNVEETPSVVEMNKDSVGKLLHEMVTIYTICGDAVRVLLQSTPEAATVEDNFGRLPLHVAVDREVPWMFAVEQLLDAYPEALNRRDGGGRLPLHIAVDRKEPSLEVVRLLLLRHPAAASARRGVGRLPLHYAVFAERPNIEVLRCLLAANPDGAATADVYGRLPLHYAVDKAVQNVAVIQYLLEVFPGGAAVRDTHLRLPLTICIDRDRVDLDIVKVLCDAYPQALSEPGPQGKLPLHVLLEAPEPICSVVCFVAKRYPAVVAAEVDPHQSPIATAISRNVDSNIIRCLLRLCPDHDPALLRRLNWEARRIALLIAGRPGRRRSVAERVVEITQRVDDTQKTSFSLSPPSPNREPQISLSLPPSPCSCSCSNSTTTTTTTGRSRLPSSSSLKQGGLSVDDLLQQLPALIAHASQPSPSQLSVDCECGEQSSAPRLRSWSTTHCTVDGGLPPPSPARSPCSARRGSVRGGDHGHGHGHIGSALEINIPALLRGSCPHLFRHVVAFL